jgi:ABC-type lipopolysaccharide export system ATPase subunit
VKPGKITGLLGRNGQGKSCLMSIIYGSLKAGKSVRFDKLSKYQPFKRPDLLLHLPQFNFIPRHLSLKRIFKDFELEYSIFEKQFPEFEKRYFSSISSLSGGERRLIELYIIVKPATRFVLLDEPFTQLSPLQIEKVKEMLSQEKQNKGMLITDHMFKDITAISESLYILKNGKTYLINDPEEIETLGYARL